MFDNNDNDHNDSNTINNHDLILALAFLLCNNNTGMFISACKLPDSDSILLSLSPKLMLLPRNTNIAMSIIANVGISNAAIQIRFEILQHSSF